MLLLVLLFRELRVHILMKSWLKNERKGALTNCLASTKKRDWAWDKIQDEWWKSGRSCVHYIELKARVGWERNRGVIKKKAGGADWSKNRNRQAYPDRKFDVCVWVSVCSVRKAFIFVADWVRQNAKWQKIEIESLEEGHTVLTGEEKRKRPREKGVESTSDAPGWQKRL